MKLLTYYQDGAEKLGIRTEQGVLDVARACGELRMVGLPASMIDAIGGGAQAIALLRALADAAASRAELWQPEPSVNFAPCVTQPGKIVCVGLNYRKHAEETKSPIPDTPILFSKFNNALAGHLEDVPLPRVTKRVDYEAELAIIIGRTAKYVSQEEALDYVFGYACANDLSARELQGRTSQWLLGKSCDKFAPLGPYLVTADEIHDPNRLTISCSVNGEKRQNSNTSDMIFHCDEIISYISRHMTLSPGDVILTGTPEGVVLGYPREQQVYLQPGDVVTIEIEGLGALTNRMAAEG